jgi:outer membrane protein assembly factor BamB/tetratricopeptide (TPR) repeat protein
MSYRRLGKLFAAGLGAMLVTSIAPAQEAVRPVEPQPQQQPAADGVGLDPNSFTGKESPEGVYVRDSALALEKFNLAQKMERLKEWDKSADLYQEVIEKYPDRVVPSRKDADDKIIQYTSVTRGVMERLAKWPKEGLDVYRGRFEPTAKQMLDAAGGLTARGDLAEMHRVLSRYFVTDTAKTVGFRLVDVNLERGEFQAAARLADELLNFHPGVTADERPALLYRAALAHRLAGDAGKAKDRLATLQKNHAAATGVVRGKDVKLAESLSQELATMTTLGEAAAVASADSWMTYGGDVSRGRVAPAGGRPGARLFAIPLARPLPRNLPAASQIQLEQFNTTNLAMGQTTGVFPVVDRGELFFQDGTRVFARSLESGNPLPGWLQTYPGEREGQYWLPNAAGQPRTHQLTLTLTDRAVLGVMGQPDRNLLTVGGAQAGEVRLVSLDRTTGKENWVVALQGMELPKDLPDDQQKSIRSLQMNGAPLVVGDSVLVAARSFKQQQFEDCWVLCFNLTTGKYRWSSYVASSSNVGVPWGMQTGSFETAAHLAYANGRVYVMSNLGALAALDAYSGMIVWLDIYERGASPFDPNQMFNGGAGGPGMMGQITKPWVYNPVIVKDGQVFALPTEGRHLYVYDANTGAEVKRVRRSDYGNTELLLAVLGDRMVIAGEKKIFCVNWRRYDMDKSEDAVEWRSAELPEGLRGRPFVTNDYVFVTDANRLYMMDTKFGRIRATYPKDVGKGWDEKEEGPGNVLVTADHVVIAGPTHVYGFTDLGLARARQDKAVAAAPADAAPRLRYAEILFAAGEPEAAIGKLDEAAKLLGGPGAAMRHGADRDWLFNMALGFAQKLAGADRDDAAPPAEPQRKLAASMYDRAATAASAAQQQVHYRLSRARFAEATKDATSAVKLYQEILSEPELRPVPLLDETSGGPTQASAVAEDAIAALVKRVGPAVYEPFEQAAAKQLADAQTVRPPKPEQLLAVAQVYPNAKVAAQALLAAADAFETAGNPRRAVGVLRDIYFKYPENPERIRIIESMARNYLALPNRVEVAAARLAQGAELQGEHKLTKPLRLPDGREIAKDTPFPAALDELRKFSGQAAAKNLPDFKLAVPPRYPPAPVRKANPRWPFPAAGAEQVIDGVSALAVPLRDYSRADRVVAWSADGNKLSVYKPGAPQPLGKPSTALSEPPKGSAWVGDGVVVWSASTVALVGPDGGEAAWRVSLKDLPNLDVVKPGGPGAATVAQIQPQLPGGGGFIVGGNVQFRRGRGAGGGNAPFVMRDGLVRFQPAVPAMGAPRPDPGAAEQIVDVRPVGDRVLVMSSTGRIASIDLTAGRIAWQTRLADRPAERLVANEDFTVLKLSDEANVRLVAMDTVTGQIRGVKAYLIQPGEVPLNIALAADGTLVFTTPSRLMLKDLYKPWEDSERDVTGVYPGQVQGVPPFLNATAPDQLIIAEGRILALAETGSPQTGSLKKFVRVHSLETGQPIMLRVPEDGGMVDLQLQTGTDSWDVKLRMIGPRLYVLNPRTVLCYNLDHPEEFWQGQIDDTDEQNVPNLLDAFFGQQHLVLLSQPGAPERRKGVYQLLGFARYPGNPPDPAESGRLDYEPTINEQQPITAWQGVEGGFYYLTGDGKLHYLAAGNK